MIIIRSQDKESLFKVDSVRYVFSLDYKHEIYADCFDIGTYATRERCLEIIDEIQDEIRNSMPSYQMPAEKEDEQMALTMRKPTTSQEARDEMKAIMKRIVEWNDKWNDGRYLSLALVAKGMPLTDDDGNPDGEIEESTIAYNNDHWEPGVTYGLNDRYEQDELRAEIAATTKGADA